MNRGVSTVFKVLVCGVLLSLASEVQAQLLYKTKFLAVEGYTNGWAIGQPAIGRPWQNLNDYPDQPNYNSGRDLWTNYNKTLDLWTNEIQFMIATITNTDSPEGGAMMVASDGNNGTNASSVYYWGIPIGTRSNAPVVTVTWDWQFFPTNEIPADYDPTNNNYNGQLRGYDIGFCLADIGNRMAACNAGGGSSNWVFCCNCTPVRLGDRQDCRYNDIGLCNGSGNWNNVGPEFKDGKKLHMKCQAYSGFTGDAAATNGTYNAWAQREGEEIWQTADADGSILGKPFGDRSCPGEWDPSSAINYIALWMNSGDWKFGLNVKVSNIRVVGALPVATPTLSIAQESGSVKLTYTGWLEAADDVKGPYTTVAVTAYPYTTPTVYTAPAGSKKFYRAVN